MFIMNGEWSCDEKNNLYIHSKILTGEQIQMIVNLSLSGVSEEVSVSQKLSDCIIYPIIKILEGDALYSRSDLEMGMMLLCDHAQQQFRFIQQSRACSSVLNDVEDQC